MTTLNLTGLYFEKSNL